MTNATRIIRRTGNSNRFRRFGIAAQVALIAFVLGANAQASPPLPETVTKHFEGIYTYSNQEGGDKEKHIISGTIQFNLVTQQAYSGYLYLDSVKWTWTATTLDHLLSFDGQLVNRPFEFSANTASLPWRFDLAWNVIGVELAYDDLAHIPWTNGRYLTDYNAGPAWDLVTNANFMPTSLLIELIFADFMKESGAIQMNLYDIHPVDIVINPRIHHGSDEDDNYNSVKKINLSSHGYTPVAVLSTNDFNSSSIEGRSVYFAGATPTGFTSRDVNGDNRKDLVCYFKNRKLKLSEGDTTATLDARTKDSRYPYIQGSGEVRVRK